MASENSADGSVVVSEESSCKWDTLSPESPEIQMKSPKPSPRSNSGMSASSETYLSKAIAKGSRAFYGTDSVASDDEYVCEVGLIGKAAHALSEDINDRIRLTVGLCSPTPVKHDPAVDNALVSENVTPEIDQPSDYQPECGGFPGQTIPSEEESKLQTVYRPDGADPTTQSSETQPSAELPSKPEDPSNGSATADTKLLEDRERQLEERVRLLKERKYSARKPPFSPGGSFIEQMKKIDLSIGGGSFKICDRNLSEDALATIATAAKNNDKLIELDLSGCCIQKGDDLADIIRNVPKLQRLFLSWNYLGSARTGVAALASAIASSPSIQEVDLRSNRIGPATAAAFALALRKNTTLKRLDLMWNEIGASGATAMLGMLERNHSLTELSLAGNNIPCQLLRQIDCLLQENRTSQSMLEDCSNAPNHRAVICRGGGTRIDRNLTECGIRAQHLVFSCEEAGMRCSNGSQTGFDSNETIQDELGSRAALNEEIKRRGQVECDLEEVKMKFCTLSQEMDIFKEEVHASSCDSSEKTAALEGEIIDKNECVRRAQELEAEANKQIQHLSDQLAMLQDDSDKRIQALEVKSKSDAEYSAGLVQKLECSISEGEQKHLEEVKAVKAHLTAEIDSLKSTKDNLLMEVDKQKSNSKLAEQQLVNQHQVLQQEKEALEKELKLQLSMKAVEIENLQSHLDDKENEQVNIKQKHEAHVQALESDLRKERASVTRAELSKSNAEQKQVTMEAEMEQLKEKYKAERERAMSLEEKNRTDELQHISCITNLCSQHLEEQEKIKGDLLIQRKEVEIMGMQLKEMQAEHERRMKDIEIQLRGAETALVEWTQQQFSALQAALSFHATVPAIDFGTKRCSQIGTNLATEEFSEADRGQLYTPRTSYTASPTQSPRNSRTSPALVKPIPAGSPRLASRVSQSMAKATPPMSPRASITNPSMATDARLPFRNPRTTRSIPDMSHTCATPSLSVASLVQPVQDDDVGTVEEDLVSNGESIDTEEF